MTRNPLLHDRRNETENKSVTFGRRLRWKSLRWIDGERNAHVKNSKGTASGQYILMRKSVYARIELVRTTKRSGNKQPRTRKNEERKHTVDHPAQRKIRHKYNERKIPIRKYRKRVGPTRRRRERNSYRGHWRIHLKMVIVFGTIEQEIWKKKKKTLVLCSRCAGLRQAYAINETCHAHTFLLIFSTSIIKMD